MDQQVSDVLFDSFISLLPQGGLVAAVVFLVGRWFSRWIEYVVKEGIPAHLREIQAGYEKIQELHLKETERLAVQLDRQGEAIERHTVALTALVQEVREIRSVTRSDRSSP